jgi:hypothetical protein
VIYTDAPVCGNNSILHRSGSGIITLRGLTNQCRARFRILFNANVAIPAAGALKPLTLAIAVNGEPLLSSLMISTPTAVSEYNNVSSSVFLDVPAGCCSQISVESTTAGTVEVANANLIIERVA